MISRTEDKQLACQTTSCKASAAGIDVVSGHATVSRGIGTRARDDRCWSVELPHQTFLDFGRAIKRGTGISLEYGPGVQGGASLTYLRLRLFGHCVLIGVSSGCEELAHGLDESARSGCANMLLTSRDDSESALSLQSTLVPVQYVIDPLQQAIALRYESMLLGRPARLILCGTISDSACRSDMPDVASIAEALAKFQSEFGVGRLSTRWKRGR